MRKLKFLFSSAVILIALFLPFVSSATEGKSILVTVNSKLMKELIKLEPDIIFFTSKSDPIGNSQDIAKNKKVVGVGSTDIASIAANFLKFEGIKSARPKEAEHRLYT